MVVKEKTWLMCWLSVRRMSRVPHAAGSLSDHLWLRVKVLINTCGGSVLTTNRNDWRALKTSGFDDFCLSVLMVHCCTSVNVKSWWYSPFIHVLTCSTVTWSFPLCHWHRCSSWTVSGNPQISSQPARVQQRAVTGVIFSSWPVWRCISLVWTHCYYSHTSENTWHIAVSYTCIPKNTADNRYGLD